MNIVKAFFYKKRIVNLKKQLMHRYARLYDLYEEHLDLFSQEDAYTERIQNNQILISSQLDRLNNLLRINKLRG